MKKAFLLIVTIFFIFSNSSAETIIAGDSIGQGTGWYLDYNNLSVSGTGLVRDDYFNWLEQLENYFDNNDVDHVYFFIGTNDAQPFYLSDGSIIPFGSNAWVTEYQRRIIEIVTLAIRENAEIIWIGPIEAENTQFNNRLRFIEDVQIGVLSGFQGQVDYIFISELYDRGILHLNERANDGIHFTRQGYSDLANYLESIL